MLFRSDRFFMSASNASHGLWKIEHGVVDAMEHAGEKKVTRRPQRCNTMTMWLLVLEELVANQVAALRPFPNCHVFVLCGA